MPRVKQYGLSTATPLLIALAALILASPPAVFGHGETGASPVGIKERLGAFVPLDTSFTAEDGSRVVLRDLVETPVILSLVYYRCANACDLVLLGLADALKSLPAVPGRDFVAITISIDETETPADAVAAKRISLAAVGEPYPPEGWRFLTGDAQSIHAIAEAVGFGFERNGEAIDHPLGLVMLSPEGKVVRYINGSAYLPADLKMSIMEASTGTIGPTISKILRFCFSYDPKSRVLVFNTLKVTGLVTLLVAGAFGLYLVLSTGKRRARGRG